MAIDARPTSFVTGAAGFLGVELVGVLVSRGHEVVGLVDSVEAAERIRRAGGVPVVGDLLVPGRWQDEAAADWVFHLPPHPVARGRGARSRPASAVRERLSMDSRLLDAVAAGATRRVVVRGGHELVRRARPARRHRGRAAPSLGLGQAPRAGPGSDSTGTHLPGCRLSPRSPDSSTATTPPGFASTSSTRSWPASASCSSAGRGP